MRKRVIEVKQNLHIMINSKIISELKELCEDRGYIVSAFVQRAIVDLIQRVKEESELND